MDSLTLKNFYTKWRLKFTYLKKITYTLNDHYWNHPKTDYTMTVTKAWGFAFKGTRDKLTKTHLVSSIGDMLMKGKRCHL